MSFLVQFAERKAMTGRHEYVRCRELRKQTPMKTEIETRPMIGIGGAWEQGMIRAACSIDEETRGLCDGIW